MDHESASRLIEIHRELEDALSMKVKINHEQVSHITTTDLLSKYEGALKRGEMHTAADLERVLLHFYMDREELSGAKEAILSS